MIRRRELLLLLGTAAAAGPCRGAKAAALEFNSPYNFIAIERQGSLVTFSYTLVAGRMSAIDLARPAYQVIPYTRYYHVAELIRPSPRQALMAGLGAGSFNRLFTLANPKARLVTVEIDPMILALAQEHAAFRPGPRDEVVIDDARLFLRRTREVFDWILLDAFDRDAQIPVHLATREFYTTLAGRLAPDGGVVLANLHQGTRFFASHVLTIRAVFPEVVLLPVESRSNVIVLAAAGAVPLRRRLAAPVEPGLQARYRAHGVDLAAIARRAVHAESYLPLLEAHGTLLTDDFAPAESLERETIPLIEP